MRRQATFWSLGIVSLTMAGVASAQTQYLQKTLVVNGHSGEAMVYQIDGKSYVDLESLARIANGTMGFNGDKIVLTLPAAGSPLDHPSEQPAPVSGMSSGFMQAALQTLSILKEWTTTLAYAIQRGTPGDGSRLVLYHNRAADQLKQARAAATSDSDQNALRLLTNHFNNVSNWSDKLVAERKAMDTGKYSITPDALANDDSYQKITACDKFLGTMLPSGQFQEGRACN